jgi:hypothetical protein
VKRLLWKGRCGPERAELLFRSKQAAEEVAKMILEQADVADVSRRVELALFYDANLDLTATS